MTSEYKSAARCRLLLALPVALAFVLICQPSAAQDEIIEVPLTDATHGVSPFEVHGKALIHEVISGPELQWSWGANVVVKNVSDKSITLVFATLKESGRHPESGHPGGLDDGPTYIIVEDRFFNTDIEPATSVVLRNTKPGALARNCCINSIDNVRSPQAEFKVLFVQYADGSIFGDPTAAAEVFARRKRSMTALRQMAEPQIDDEKVFSEKLDQQCAALGSICPKISQAFERNGERGALTEMERLLGISDTHVKLLAVP